MGIVIKWDITYKCNLFCEHCINGNFLEKNPNEVTFKEAVRIIDNISSYIDIDRIHFLGGEPLTRKDFIDILEYLDSKQIKFGFNTNGLLFAGKNMERICSLANLDSVILSIEGPNAEVNDNIRGKNVFNILIDRLNKVRQYRKSSDFNVIVNMVVMKTNYIYIKDMVKLCDDFGVDEINFLEFIEDGNGTGSGLSLSDDEFIDCINSIARLDNEDYNVKMIPKFTRPLAIDYARECLGLDFPLAVHACGAGTNSIFIDNNGIVYNCDRDRNLNGNGYDLTKDSFDKIWDETYFTKPFTVYQGSELYNNVEPCNGCKYLYKECFPCYLKIQKDQLQTIKRCKLLNDLINSKQVGGVAV